VLRADLTFKEVQEPHNRWCRSGHVAPETFRREGPGTEAIPTRFFRVSSVEHPNVNGTYCEPCVVVAFAIHRVNKKMEIK
jgi:hypothetical protein